MLFKLRTMKSILLSFSALLLCTSVTMGQSIEIGVNGGMSNTLKPGESLYKGDKNVWNYAADVNVHYGFNDHWEIGLNIGMTKWERLQDWHLFGPEGVDLGIHEVKYVFAQRAVSFAFSSNYVIPIYKQYEDYVKARFYVGLSTGAVFIGNDGEEKYGRVNPFTPKEYTYTSEFHFQSGYGFLAGAQAGFTYYFNQTWGVNLDFSPKIAWVKTVDPRFNHANDLYSIIYYPITLGVHVRF